MSFFFRKRTPRGPRRAHCKSDANSGSTRARAHRPTRNRTRSAARGRDDDRPRPKSTGSGGPPAPRHRRARRRRGRAPTDVAVEDAAIDAAAEPTPRVAAYVDDAARAGARLQESDAPPISCFGEEAFCMSRMTAVRRSAASWTTNRWRRATASTRGRWLAAGRSLRRDWKGRYRCAGAHRPGPRASAGGAVLGLDLYLEGAGSAPTRLGSGRWARGRSRTCSCSDEDIDDAGVPRLRVVLKVSLS